MTTELTAYITLGFRHIVSPDALDHWLFLVALAAAYRPRDWRPALAVITAFTVGHSITLALAVTGLLVLPVSIVEFLIPVTIVITCLESLVAPASGEGRAGRWYRPLLAALFGLVHGAGFAGYLASLMMTEIVRPLLGFNIGIELGQVLVLAAIGALFVATDAVLTRLRRGQSGFRWRAATVSTVVLLVACRLAWARVP